MLAPRGSKQLFFLEKIDRVPENFEKAAQLLRELDITDFFFYGGALRDYYLKRPESDIDVDGVTPKNNQFWRTVYAELDNLHKKRYGGIFTQRNSQHLRKIFAEKGVECLSYSGMTIKLRKGDGPLVDLRIKGKEEGVLDGRYFEAPINALTMTSRGEMYTSPDTPEHLAQQIFQPQEGNNNLRPTLKGLIRFAHLQAKNPDLSYVPAKDAHKLVPAWLVAQKYTGIPNALARHIFKIRRHVIDVTP